MLMSNGRYHIDTISEFGSIYLNDPEGNHMSWIDVESKLNELDIENNYLKIHKDKFERKYLETMLENKSLKKDMKNKKELISNLESKVIRQKGQLRNLNKSKFKIILDFCNWLREQGAEYETINYGDDADIAEMINEYLKEEGD